MKNNRRGFLAALVGFTVIPSIAIVPTTALTTKQLEQFSEMIGKAYAESVDRGMRDALDRWNSEA